MITCADDALHLECGDSTHPDATGHSTATDICSTPVVTYHDGEDTDPSDCVETFIRTWTATDACGNTSTCEQTITLTDTQQPYWTSDLPGDLTLECGADIPAQAELTAADACQAVVTVAEAQSSSTGDCGNTTVIVYVWTADDGCTDPISHTPDDHDRGHDPTGDHVCRRRVALGVRRFNAPRCDGPQHGHRHLLYSGGDLPRRRRHRPQRLRGDVHPDVGRRQTPAATPRPASRRSR